MKKRKGKREGERGRMEYYCCYSCESSDAEEKRTERYDRHTSLVTIYKNYATTSSAWRLQDRFLSLQTVFRNSEWRERRPTTFSIFHSHDGQTILTRVDVGNSVMRWDEMKENSDGISDDDSEIFLFWNLPRNLLFVSCTVPSSLWFVWHIPLSIRVSKHDW